MTMTSTSMLLLLLWLVLCQCYYYCYFICCYYVSSGRPYIFALFFPYSTSALKPDSRRSLKLEEWTVPGRNWGWSCYHIYNRCLNESAAMDQDLWYCTCFFV